MSVFREVNSNTKKRYVCLAPSQGSCREEPYFKMPRFLHGGTVPSRSDEESFPQGHATKHVTFILGSARVEEKPCALLGASHLVSSSYNIHRPAPWYFTYPCGVRNGNFLVSLVRVGAPEGTAREPCCAGSTAWAVTFCCSCSVLFSASPTLSTPVGLGAPF